MRLNKYFWALTISLFHMPGSIEATFAQTSSTSAPTAIEFILDASGSMLLEEKGEKKIVTAKKMMSVAIESIEQENAITSLRVFGHQKPRNCNAKLIEQRLGFYPKDQGRVKEMIKEITPVERGMTPIGESLKQSFNSLKEMPGKKRIILITDGEETCKGDPCAEAKRLQEQLDVKIYVLTYGAKSVEDFKELECLGETKNADSPESFSDALSEFKFDALNTKQTIIVKGPEPDAWAMARSTTNPSKSFRFVSSLGTNLPPDTYDVEVFYQPPFSFKKVVLAENQRKVLSADGQGFLTLPMPSFPIQLIAQDLLSSKEFVFYAGEEVKVPVSRYSIFATTTTGLAHQWDNISVTPGKVRKLEAPDWGMITLKTKNKEPYDIFSQDTQSPSVPNTATKVQTKITSVSKFKNSQGFFLTNNRYVLPQGRYTIVIKDKKIEELNIQRGKLLSFEAAEPSKKDVTDLMSPQK
jgi:hypothetical protein